VLTPDAYTNRLYKIHPVRLIAYKQRHWERTVGSLVLAWMVIVGLVQAVTIWPVLWWGYPVVALFIAGRAGVMLQVAHEACHRLICSGPFNNWMGQAACAMIGLDFQEYKDGHLKHHVSANTAEEPENDREKYKVCDIRDPRLWGLFAKDWLGMTAWEVRLRYAGGVTASAWPKYLRIGLAQLVILGVVFQGHLWHYWLLWPLPLMTAHMFLMRVRGIAEHGLAPQLGYPVLPNAEAGDYYTRSFGTPSCHYAFWPFLWLERALIGSLNVYYHHEHHLFPTIPYYHLPLVHEEIAREERRHNTRVFAKGYVACLWPSSS